MKFDVVKYGNVIQMNSENILRFYADNFNYLFVVDPESISHAMILLNGAYGIWLKQEDGAEETLFETLTTELYNAGIKYHAYALLEKYDGREVKVYGE